MCRICTAYCTVVVCSLTRRGRRLPTRSPHPCRGRCHGSSGATGDTIGARVQAAGLQDNFGILRCLHGMRIMFTGPACYLACACKDATNVWTTALV